MPFEIIHDDFVRRTPLTVFLGSIACTGFASIDSTRRVRSRPGRRGRGPEVGIAVYLCHIVLGLDYTELGRAFGCDRTTARRLCFRIEDQRDHAGFDGALEALEQAALLWASAFCGAGQDRAKAGRP